MSLDRSLKSANSLIRHRNVLTRAERLDTLKEAEKWTDKKSVFGLPKVAHRKQEAIKAVKEETAEGAVAGTTPVAGAAPAAGAKGAAPAAAGKAPAGGGKTPAAAAGKAAPAAKAPAAPAGKKK